MKRTYRYDKTTGKMVETTGERQRAINRGIMIMEDLKPFVSPITKEVISGRVAFREHCKEHNVTNISDYNTPGGYWDKKAQERAKVFETTGFDSDRRKQAITQAFDKLTRR